MKYISIVLLALIVFFANGCQSATMKASEDITAPEQFSLRDETAGKELSEKYIAALVKAVQTKDFNVISPYLNADMLSIRQKRSIFNDMCKRLEQNGKLISYSFVAAADQTLCRDYIWQLNFEKTTKSEKLPVIKTVLFYSVRIVVANHIPEIVRTRLIQL